MSRSIVDTEVIAAAAGDINRLAESIQSDVATLRGRLASLDGAWEGPAKAEGRAVIIRRSRYSYPTSTAMRPKASRSAPPAGWPSRCC